MILGDSPERAAGAGRESCRKTGAFYKENL